MRIDVKKLLLALGEQQMSVNELAQKSAVSRTTIAAIKAGKTCRPEIAGRIAKAINKPLVELIED